MNSGIRSEISMSDQSFTSKWTDQPIGLIALIQEPDYPSVDQLFEAALGRETIITSEAIKEYYPYVPSGII
jgi:hypothetical protein